MRFRSLALPGSISIVRVLGLLVIVTVWPPRMSRATWVTALGWGLLVTLMAIIGGYAVRMTVVNPPIFAFGEELIWGPSYGVIICALGIVICLVGVALLAREEIRRARQVRQSWPQHVQRA